MILKRLKAIRSDLAGDDEDVTPYRMPGRKVDGVKQRSMPAAATAAPIVMNAISQSNGKKLSLKFSASSDWLNAIASATLQAGGYVEAPPREPEIGETMPDGTVYAGVSPDTGTAMYAMSADGPQPMQWKEAMTYAEELDAQGHKDWRLPTKGELNVLFNDRGAIGGFNVTGSNPAGWYWTSVSPGLWGAWDQRFNDGYQDYNGKDIRASVRCVR
jgi:hypothetical protein